ncbi:anti-sigma F factor [Bacillus sp. JCM 19046]|uniref:Anti-sigma F factor n=1 Tax=Shouchella xiaoxiensis TaxID=766895 RepID=A0ABS2SRU3_9BACI|nr:anti-sigma F factor [Shouchella xiaoxiensis]MBM7838221.1 stage II sporulation protein AB (anti-sigma F factor) [Shouchella xiaoxiensis]GAF12095.1 anti-sigma F factor [Bacillus sp. JCM 19045]GAF17886.1 anti-sigma F factor [Bacillus sp. JCM 19046]
MTNKMELAFSAKSENESFARVTVGAFIAQLDPTMEELTEIKTIVSEAVTNSIIHGYENDSSGQVFISAAIRENEIELIIRDEGIGISDVDEARQPLYTSKPELERSGMGFTIMENFSQDMKIVSEPLIGTTVYVKKQLTTTKAVCR